MQRRPFSNHTNSRYQDKSEVICLPLRRFEPYEGPTERLTQPNSISIRKDSILICPCDPSAVIICRLCCHSLTNGLNSTTVLACKSSTSANNVILIHVSQIEACAQTFIHRTVRREDKLLTASAAEVSYTMHQTEIEFTLKCTDLAQRLPMSPLSEASSSQEACWLFGPQLWETPWSRSSYSLLHADRGPPRLKLNP